MVVVITPNKEWPNATKCTIIDGSTHHRNVPIARKTPQGQSEVFQINWGGNPQLVLSNMNPDDPQNSDPIIEGQENLNTMRIPTNQDPVDVQILANIGWPSGKVILPHL